MLTLTLRQLTEKLPAWIEARLSVALVGPPGTGKTYTSREVATQTGLPVEVVDGGQENDWKALFPYKLPTGEIELGKAMRAAGFDLVDGEVRQVAPGGVLIIDEFNRVPPELKTSFQLLASEKIVPWPGGGVRKVDVAIISTANSADLGVEEAARAELDRYDLILKLYPTLEEIGAIVARSTGVREEAAAVMYDAVAKLASKLDPKKFHLPEGIRMAISIARIIRSGTLGPRDAFVGAAQRCFPLGRHGAEKHRAEFDQVVADAAGEFASRLADLGRIESGGSSQQAAPSRQDDSEVKNLQDLQNVLANSLEPLVNQAALPLPASFPQLMHVFTEAFGLGVTKHLFRKLMVGASSAERRGVKVHFGANGAVDSVEFAGAERHKVMTFLRALTS